MPRAPRGAAVPACPAQSRVRGRRRRAPLAGRTVGFRAPVRVASGRCPRVSRGAAGRRAPESRRGASGCPQSPKAARGRLSSSAAAGVRRGAPRGAGAAASTAGGSPPRRPAARRGPPRSRAVTQRRGRTTRDRESERGAAGRGGRRPSPARGAARAADGDRTGAGVRGSRGVLRSQSRFLEKTGPAGGKVGEPGGLGPEKARETGPWTRGVRRDRLADCSARSSAAASDSPEVLRAARRPRQGSAATEGVGSRCPRSSETGTPGPRAGGPCAGSELCANTTRIRTLRAARVPVARRGCRLRPARRRQSRSWEPRS